MPTSGVTNTEFPADFVITEAYERCGREPGDLTAWSLQTAINSLNLLFLDWQNQNVLEWMVDKQEVTLTKGAEYFDTEAGTVSVLNAYLRRGDADDADTPLISIDRVAYSEIPNKTDEGRPDRYWQYRAAGAVPRLYIWQTSDADDDVVHYWRIKRTDDVTAPTETLGTVDRWLEATAAALAVKLWEKTPVRMIAEMTPACTRPRGRRWPPWRPRSCISHRPRTGTRPRRSSRPTT